MPEISEKIKALRRYHQISRTQFAHNLDVTTDTVRRWEIGELPLEAENLFKLSHYFRVPPAFFDPEVTDIETIFPLGWKRRQKIDVANLPITESKLIGRDEWVGKLNHLLHDKQKAVLTVYGYMGCGKSSLVNYWLDSIAVEHYRGAEYIYGWSFALQEDENRDPVEDFVNSALEWFGDSFPLYDKPRSRIKRLLNFLRQRPTILILDGLDCLLRPLGGTAKGEITDANLRYFLRELIFKNNGLCVISTRIPLGNLSDSSEINEVKLENIDPDSAIELLKRHRIWGEQDSFAKVVDELDGHCLSLILLSNYLNDIYGGKVEFAFEGLIGNHNDEKGETLFDDLRAGELAQKMVANYENWFSDKTELLVLKLLAERRAPVDTQELSDIVEKASIPQKYKRNWQKALERLSQLGLLKEQDNCIKLQTLIQQYFAEKTG